MDATNSKPGNLKVENDLSVGGTVTAKEFLYPVNGENASLGESVMDCCTLCSSINNWLDKSFGNYSRNSVEGTLEVNYQSIKVGETDGCLLSNNYIRGQEGLEVNGNFDIERDCHIGGNLTVDGSVNFASKAVVVGDIIIGTQSLRGLLDRWLGINGGDVPDSSGRGGGGGGDDPIDGGQPNAPTINDPVYDANDGNYYFTISSDYSESKARIMFSTDGSDPDTTQTPRTFIYNIRQKIEETTTVTAIAIFNSNDVASPVSRKTLVI